MAGPYYLRSTDGSDASDGLSWANAKATLAGLAAVIAAGETGYISQAHAETQASAMTLTFAGTAAAPVILLCVNDAAEPPTALATTATITTTSGGITWRGVIDIHGCAVASEGNFSFTSAVLTVVRFSSCQLSLGASASFYDFAPSNAASLVRLTDTTVTFAATGQTIYTGARFDASGGSMAATGTVPTSLFTTLAAYAGSVLLRGVDLSALGSGKNLVNVTNAAPQTFAFAHCKLAASVSVKTGTPPGPGGAVVLMDNCDSGDTQTRMQRHIYEGDVYSETTIVRTGGASNGTTPFSRKLVSSAGASFTNPFYGPDMTPHNAAIGSAKTVTVEFIHDSVTNLQDDEVWLEVEYLGTTGFPLSLFASDRMANILSTPADQTDSSEAWTTTGLTNPNTQKLSVTVTPQEIGIVRCRVALAKPSATLYYDTKVAIA